MLGPYPPHPRTAKASLHPLDTGVAPASAPTSASTSSPASPPSPSRAPLRKTSLSLDDQRAHLRTVSPPPPPSAHAHTHAGAGTTSRRRKFFRLRRPSSSSAALQPGYTSDLHRLREDSELELACSPPRPARRLSRPPSPSAIQEAAEEATTTTTTKQRPRSASLTQSPLRAFGPILNAGSDFVLQRRKSRGSRARRQPEPDPGAAGSTPRDPHDSDQLQLQFSTTDRRILEELRHRMQAREAQFRLVNGKKHHPYRAEQVPYPCSYERRVVDNDIWECKWAQQTCGDVSFHVFEEPPQKVLDVGCGSGSWILDCAMQWKETSFVGLDIVPLHADLQEVGRSQLASRITWVQANFLEGLPFPSEEFDFVHVKRIARGVPEDKWDALLEDIARVMKPGGAFQLLEEELSFPGHAVDPDLPESVADLPTAASSPWSSTSVFELQSQPSTASSKTSLSSSAHAHAAGLKAERPRGHTFAGAMVGTGLAVLPPIIPVQPAPHPHPPSHAHPPGHAHAHAHTDEPAKPPEGAAGRTPDDPRAHARPDAPRDPRDHALLEHIYNETHAARFVNLEPLALLANSLSLYFTDVRTHPPLVLTFPPRPMHAAARAAADPARSHARASPPPRASAVEGTGHGPRAGTEGRTHEDADADADAALTAQTPAPPALLDARRASAFPPPARPRLPLPLPARRRARSFSDVHGLRRASAAPSLAPGTHPALDVRTLNMHLALRTQEVLACAESMWACVLAHQRRAHAIARPAPRVEAQLLALTRRDFDELLDYFELDMQDNICLGDAVRGRLGWGPAKAAVAPNERRKDFVQACKQWELAQRKKETQAGNAPPADGGGRGGDEERELQDHPNEPHAGEDAPPLGGSGDADEPGEQLSEATVGAQPQPQAPPSIETQTQLHSQPQSQPQTRSPQTQTQTQAQAKSQAEPLPPPSPPTARPSPAERVSRIMRVFVAWKS